MAHPGDDSDIVLTPALRAYLAAFDAWLRAPGDELARRRRSNALSDVLDGPRVKTCKHGHLVTGDNRVRNGTSGYFRCRQCLRETSRRTRARNRSSQGGAP